MSTQITTAFVRQWERGITHLAEQKESRLRSKVRMIRISDGDRAYIDQVGSVTATAATTRHGDTPLTDTPHSRRQITLTPYKHADLVDKSDQIRTLNDPTNAYSQAMAMAVNRQIDDIIIAAALGTAATGETGTGTQTANASTIAAGGNIVLAELLNIKRGPVG